MAKRTFLATDRGTVAGALQFDGVDDYVETDPILYVRQMAQSMRLLGSKAASQAKSLSLREAAEAGGCRMLPQAHGKQIPQKPAGTGRNSHPVGPPLTCPTMVPGGEWHRVGFVWDGSNRILYVDPIVLVRHTATAERDKTPRTSEERRTGGRQSCRAFFLSAVH